MNDRDWENWLVGRQGTIMGDAKIESMKYNKPTPIKTFHPKTKSGNANSSISYANPTNISAADAHQNQEDAIAGVISLGIFGLLAYSWFYHPDIRTMEWYWYFGLGIAVALGTKWLLINHVRPVLTLLRLAIKVLVYIALIGGLIWAFTYFVN